MMRTRHVADIRVVGGMIVGVVVWALISSMTPAQAAGPGEVVPNPPVTYPPGMSSNPNDNQDARGVVTDLAYKQAVLVLGSTYGDHAPDGLADFMLTVRTMASRPAMARGLRTFGAWDNPRTMGIEFCKFTANTICTNNGWTYASSWAETDTGCPVYLGLTSSFGEYSVLGVGNLDRADWSAMVWNPTSNILDNLALTDIPSDAALGDFLNSPSQWFFKVTDFVFSDIGSIQDFQVRYRFDFDKMVFDYVNHPMPVNNFRNAYMYLATISGPATLILLSLGGRALLGRRRF